MKQKNKLDEMQEQKLLKIEHYGVWYAFWGLLLMIVIQTIAGGENALRYMTGEFIIFFTLAIYLLVACLKNGIWDRRLAPNLRTNMIISLATSFLCGFTIFIVSYFNYHHFMVSVASGFFTMLFTLFLTLVALSAAAAVYKKRVTTLENTVDDKHGEPDEQKIK
jgi:cytochrome c biogenesis factor